MTIQTERYENIEVKDKSGKTYEVNFTRSLNVYTERYGDDADGNRGEVRTVVDNDHAIDIELVFEDNLIPYKDLSKEEKARVDEAVEDYIDDTEPELQ